MRNRAYLIVALLGLLTFALAPGYAAAAVQGQNLTEIALASDAAARASVVSATIDVNPLAADLGIVNIGSSASTNFVITNAGGSDLHIGSVGSSNPDFHVLSFPPMVSSGGGTGILVVSFNPNSSPGMNEAGVITINSDASNGMAFGVNVTGSGNAAPTLAPIGNKSGAAFVTLSFSASGTDDNDQVADLLTYSVVGLPPGATFNTTTGAFSWTPGAGDAGDYPLTFCTSDGRLDDCESINIHVIADNHPPVANAGGPYAGGPGQPIQFNGSASSDPDGDNLTFAWSFGDGGTAGNDPTPTHAYALINNYLVTLTVTDDGSPNLQGTGTANVQVIASLPSNISAKLAGATMKIHGGGLQLMGMELVSRPVTDINAATIKLGTTYPGGPVSQISPVGKAPTVGDIDHDNVADIDVAFNRDDIATLFPSTIPNNTVVTLVMTAHTTAGAGNLPIQGTIQVKIKSTGPAGVSAFASPNPFNPATSVKYSLRKAGEVSVRIYSLEGRLVKTLMEGVATAGTHEVLWDGRDNGGNSVRSGMYFVKTSSGGESAVFKLALLK
jgi:PKD repeat protein